MKNNLPKSNILAFQPELRPALPTIEGNVDYHELRMQLERIEEILVRGGIENKFVELSFARWLERSDSEKKEPGLKQQSHYQRHSRQALRCNIARTLLGEDFRGMSCRIAESFLLQRFCLVDRLDVIRVPSKSTLQRYADWISADEMREMISHLLCQACDRIQKGEQILGLKKPVDIETYFLDTSCVKANIHFPVDWVLLRDATRTLMKAVMLIRKEGLKQRMNEPQEFMKRMNRLSIRMTHSRRKSEGKKQRKEILRLMKRQVKVVASHARSHCKLLDACWEQTDLSRKQAEQILHRMDGVLNLLPRAQKQAHERIIGERFVDNADKILSLYEKEIRVIVRGKAGAEVEFGNTLLLGEQHDGVIVDWKLIEEQAPSDSALVQGSVQRVECAVKNITIRALATDRGFESQTNVQWLKKRRTYNAMAPRKIEELKNRLDEQRFCELQKRRAQTEARVAIFKNQFLGKPMRSKGFGNRESQIAWGILTHNLWVIARLPSAVKVRSLKKAA